MNLEPTTEQGEIDAALTTLLSKESPIERVRSVERGDGFDAPLWTRLVEFGVLDMAAPETPMADLAVVARRCGSFLALVPVVEALVAARLLARLGRVGGDLTTFAPRPVSGDLAHRVPWAAAAARSVVRRGDHLLLADASTSHATSRHLWPIGLADVELHDAPVLASGGEAVEAHLDALADWRTLTAAGLLGQAVVSLELGVDYVKERHQFGVPIATFQSVQHQLADAAASVDGASLLVAEAAWSANDRPDRYRGLAAMSYAFASQVAADVALTSLHLHGGYGYMEEYDIQLHYRRARALRVAAGDPRLLLVEIAELEHTRRVSA